MFACVYVFRNVFVRFWVEKSNEIYGTLFSISICWRNSCTEFEQMCVCVSMWLVYKLFRWNCVFIFLFFCRQMTTLKEMWISSFFSFIGGNNKKFSPPSNLRIQWHLILWLWWLNFLFCFVCFSTLELKSTHWNRIRIKLVLIVIWCWRNTQIFFLFVAEVHFNYTKCLLVNGLYVMRLKEFNFI